MLLPKKVPIFPLKGVILFPNCFLPLNIFEKRYILMIEDILRTGERMLGVIQPKVITSQKTNKLSIQDVGCLARLIKFEELDDGRFLITLKGVSRFKALPLNEHENGYKISNVNLDNFKNDVDSNHKIKSFKYQNDKKLKIVLTTYFKKQNINADFDYINKCENKDLVDQISMICPFEPEEKQMLLESKCIENRYILLISILEDNLNLENKTNVIKH